MGAGVSTVVGGEGPSRPGGLADLPESCVASVLVNLGPTEICRLAGLNRAFRGAATSDSVWKSKLPENYAYLLEKADSDGVRRKGVTKKEIYERLCWTNPFGGGKKVFWLEKSKGGFCMSISSKALSITGIDDRRYWNYIPCEESRMMRHYTVDFPVERGKSCHIV